MMLVLSAIAGNGLNLTVVTADGYGESDNIVAGADQLKIVFGDTSLRSSAIEEKFNLLEETRLFGRVVNLAGECAQSYPCK